VSPKDKRDRVKERVMQGEQKLTVEMNMKKA
jgi:hypothetical protein